jgi:hypothetical protein
METVSRTMTEAGRRRSVARMTLADEYLKRYGCGLHAYMALQRALMRRFVASGGTKEDWCVRFAPLFRRRYASVFAIPGDAT